MIGCSALQAEQPVSVLTEAPEVHIIPQEGLHVEACGGPAVIYIGGMGDEISGIVPRMMTLAPRVSPMQAQAYYHWHLGVPENVEQGAAQLAELISAFRRNNPQADVILIGHSMGAGSALRIAKHLTPQDGRVFLITLDPSDRSCSPERPECVTWWGNSYVVNSLSGHDYIAVLGGRWNYCSEADVNICFDGRMRDEAGYNYIHDNAYALMLSRGRGRHPSLFDSLREALRRAKK
ncbi:MAG: alpha/beta hydrolase [Akkermansia sp.]|nr:alpha/beta hydrolase [Akkermansia sp.]